MTMQIFNRQYRYLQMAMEIFEWQFNGNHLMAINIFLNWQCKFSTGTTMSSSGNIGICHLWWSCFDSKAMHVTSINTIHAWKKEWILNAFMFNPWLYLIDACYSTITILNTLFTKYQYSIIILQYLSFIFEPHWTNSFWSNISPNIDTSRRYL